MKVVFADTGYWEAVLNPNDKLHLKARQVSASLGNVRLLTTEMVLCELLAALSKLLVRPSAINGVQAIRSNPNVEVIPQTSLQFATGFDLYRLMTDKEWSLTDCASFNVMRERGLTEALAHDRHFEQAGFVALLR
ncbi:MAG: PIN domain-containing protein [Betaproteobacteria bacterium]|nr:PIN domain-containing protein [Betaproteobacteria bacterium]